jgi:hypothetical protein
MVFGRDHILSEQEAAPEEIAAIREWLSRDGACPLLAPDHDVRLRRRHEATPGEYLHQEARAIAEGASRGVAKANR